MKTLAAALALLMAGASLLPAQEMRDYSVARQHHGESRLSASLEFVAGTIHVGAGRDDELYRMQLRYDPGRFVPVSRFDAGSGSLRLGIENAGKAGLRVSSRAHLDQVAAVELSPLVPLSLDVNLGAANASLELGGLRLGNLRLVTSATQATVSFHRANPIRCSSMTIESGAAGLTLEQLGNSRCETVRISGGMGQTILDLGGAWGQGGTITVKMTVGALTLRIPRTLGVRIRSDQFLSSFPSKGWTNTGGALLSPGYASAREQVDLRLETALGDVNVEWER